MPSTTVDMGTGLTPATVHPAKLVDNTPRSNPGACSDLDKRPPESPKAKARWSLSDYSARPPPPSPHTGRASGALAGGSSW